MDKGDLDAEYSYASLIYNGYGGLPQNLFDAMEIYKKLARMAHPPSQYALATIYADRLNDYKTAIELYNLAGNNSLAKAWTNLGIKSFLPENIYSFIHFV